MDSIMIYPFPFINYGRLEKESPLQVPHAKPTGFFSQI